ncbi:MAG: DUF2961 domain-containing protein [Actinobacteria bacterium]|nr:DUF2961 domain-containing protein [Actinomycetota bacterium]
MASEVSAVFFNIAKDVLGLGPADGVTRQVSSHGRRTWLPPGMLGETISKCVDLPAGKEYVAADLPGPGLVTRIWMTVPRQINPGVLKKVTLKIRWDDEEEPSVLVPLGDLFGTTFGRPKDYSSAWLAITSGAYLCFFPMPFARRAFITLENEGRLPVAIFFYQVTYLELKRDLPGGTPYFHCYWSRERCHRGGEPFTVLSAAGGGFYMGCHMDMQGAGYPWRLNPYHSFSPEGWGLGMLEGWERMWIDGSCEPNVHGTGGEDYFNSAWYFTRVPSTHPTHGVTRRDYFSRRVSCYRFHVEMPVAFERQIEVVLDHGLHNRLPAVFDCTAYWYQSEPHRPYPGLPPVAQRGSTGGTKNRLVMLAPLAYAGAAVGLYRHARKVRATR